MRIILTSVFLIMLSVGNLFAVIAPAEPPSGVGAPLDGGLLAILAAAGISYFAARKKKKQAN